MYMKSTFTGWKVVSLNKQMHKIHCDIEYQFYLDWYNNLFNFISRENVLKLLKWNNGLIYKY